MHKITLGRAPEGLDPWGVVSNLGAEPIEGKLEICGRMVFGAPDAAVSCGYFGCTKGVFRMTYPFNEHAVMVEGHVTLTLEATGEVLKFGPGDAWFVEKGTVVLWKIESERFVKNYFAVV